MEEERSGFLCSSANWLVSDGSIEGSISFDTSSSSAADDGADAIPTGVLLLRPPSMDSTPCEITICFRSKYEIYRVYVRSTARVFEIYYTSDNKDKSNEYLCTVRCGEVTSGGDDQEYVTECQKESNETAASCDKLGQNDNGVGDEDEWVEVKVPHSPQQGNETISLTKMVHRNTKTIKEVLYEATAEIADASPCVTLTLRLLSLKNKACVHVEEIYIYADPVELTDPDNSGSTTGSIERSSLLAMLVPNLLQLSKSGSGRMQDRYSSDDLMVQKPQNTLEKAAESSMVAERKVPHEINPNQNQKLHMDESRKDKAEITDSFISREKYAPVHEQDNLVYSRVEKMLDELVSRVGKIEAFCSRFEENMMKPLGCIEMRLQQLEHQLEAFATRMPSSEPLSCSKISVPEFSFDESDLEHNDSNTSQPVERDNSILVDDVADSLPDSQLSPCLVVKAPEFSTEDDEPGLVVKAPEFSTEDDEQIDNNNTGVSLDSTEKDPPQVKKFLSIEDALASAFNAFLSSTSDTCPQPSPNMTDKQESSDGENNAVAPINPEDPREGSSCLSDDIDLGKKHCSLSDTVVSERTTFDAVLPFAKSESVATPVSDSQLHPSPASYFLTKEDDPISRNEAPDPGLREFSSALAFASFSSPTKEAPEVSFGKKNVSSSFVGMSCEGDEIPGVENCSKDVTNDAQLSPAANFLPHGLVEEQNEPATGEKRSSMDVPAGGSNPNGCLPEVSVEQKEHLLKWQEDNSVSEFDEFVTHLHSFVSGSNSSYSNFHDGQLADESDDGGMSCEGDEIPGVENCSKDVTNDAQLPRAANFLPHGLVEEQNEPATGEKRSSMDVPAGGSNPNGRLPEVSVEQKENLLKWQEYNSAIEFDEYVKHLHSFFSASNSSYSNFYDGQLADESDDEENSSQKLGLGQLGRRWTEDSCTDSSIDEVFMKNKVVTGWSDASSGGFLSQLDGSITDDFGSNQATEDSTTIQSILSEPSICHNHEKLENEAEWNFTFDYELPVLDVKFPPVKAWISGIPLEVLLGDSSGPQEQYPSAKDDDNHNLGTQQDDSFSHQDLDRSQSLLDVEELTVPAEAYGSHDALHGHQIDNDQLFSSLI